MSRNCLEILDWLQALEMREEDPEIYPQVARAFAAMAMESGCI